MKTQSVAAALLACLVWSGQAFAQERLPPRPHCMDATRIADAVPVDDKTMAFLLSDEGRFRVSFQQACPGFNREQGVRLLGRGGWICGDEGEAMRTDAGLCAVAEVQPVDAREFAELLRHRDQSNGVQTLQDVVVTKPRAKGFIGTTDYCVSNAALRSWRDDGSLAVVVEVSPKRSGGNRYYRVELEQSCGDLVNADTLQLVSGMGLGVVCGHPGDRVMTTRLRPADMDRPLMQSTLASAHGCRISRVYPLPKD